METWATSTLFIESTSSELVVFKLSRLVFRLSKNELLEPKVLSFDESKLDTSSSESDNEFGIQKAANWKGLCRFPAYPEHQSAY